MAFHLELLWGATLMPHRGCAMDWDITILWGWVKNSGPVLNHLWTKVHEIFGQQYVGDPSHFPTPLPDCLHHVSFSRYSPLSIEIVKKPNKCKSVLAPIFFGETTPTFLRQIEVLFADLHLRSLTMKCNADFTEGGWKLTSNLKPFVDQSSCRFETM